MSLWWQGAPPSALVRGKWWDSAALMDEASPPPTLLSLPTLRFLSIACGAAHSLALTTEGRLFAWGWNERGQLGFGDMTARVAHPKPLGFFTGQLVGAIACGAAHSAAFACPREESHTWEAHGEVTCYTWGASEAGQLGLPAKLLHSSLNTQGVVLDTSYPQVSHGRGCRRRTSPHLSLRCRRSTLQHLPLQVMRR